VGRWLYRPSLLVAIAMLFAVPFATLETPDIVAECCCPSPEICKCPDHRADRFDHSSMRSCHRTSHHLTSSKLARFLPPMTTPTLVPPAPALVATAFTPLLHPTPRPRPPDVPS
jgi:hypothetical protein